MNLNKTLEKHKKWLNGEKGGERADLSGANLRRADLRGADLREANLRGANLRIADLCGAIGNGKEIKTIGIIDDYHINYTHDRIQIGCKNFSIAEWMNFSDHEIDEMDKGKSLNFWKKHKTEIFERIKNDPATPTGHEG